MAFLHSFHPSPILFQFGPIQIHWYGLLIVCAIFIGLFIVLRLSKYYGFTSDNVYDLGFYIVIFSLMGARVYAVLLYPAYYFHHPLEIFQPWKGGLAIHGVILGGALTLLLYCRAKKQSFWKWGDIIVVALALGQALGRWGNYFNQEVYGKPTSLPWGIPIDAINRVAGYENFEFFHPTFLYESILNLFVFIVLISLHLLQIKKRNSKGNKLPTSSFQFPTGLISIIYLISYSVIRIIMEQFRIDETPVFFGIRFPVYVSGVIIIASLFLMYNKFIMNNQKISRT